MQRLGEQTSSCWKALDRDLTPLHHQRVGWLWLCKIDNDYPPTQDCNHTQGVCQSVKDNEWGSAKNTTSARYTIPFHNLPFTCVNQLFASTAVGTKGIPHTHVFGTKHHPSFSTKMNSIGGTKIGTWITFAVIKNSPQIILRSLTWRPIGTCTLILLTHDKRNFTLLPGIAPGALTIHVVRGGVSVVWEGSWVFFVHFRRISKFRWPKLAGSLVITAQVTVTAGGGGHGTGKEKEQWQLHGRENTE